jgi:WD40 repeat protein
MDCLSGKFSEYYIALGLCDSGLREMALNPNDVNQIALGFESECIVWDFAQKRPIERFVLQDTLIACAWKPEGGFLVTGYNDGLIAFWTTKKG